jgi:PAS domain S-box-containing protein
MARQKGNGRKDSSKYDVIQDERYRLLFESSSDAIMLLDRERFFDCNKAAQTMFGLSKEEFIKLHPSEISPPSQLNGKDSRTEADKKTAEAFTKGVNKFEWIHRRSNGEDFAVLVWLTAFQLEGRQVLQSTVRELSQSDELQMDLEAHRLKLQMLLDEKTSGIKKEVVERKKAETEVKRLIKAVETSFNAVVLFDMDMNFLYANNSFCRMSKIPRGELTRRNAREFIPEESLKTLLENIYLARGGEEIEPFEITTRTAEGKELWVEIAGSILFNDDGEPECLLGIINDITERKNIHDALVESEEKFKMMVERSLDGILIIQDGKVAYMNPALVNLSGYTLEEQIGRDFIDNVAPEARKAVMTAHKARMSGMKVPSIYETILMTKDGTRVLIEVNAGVMDYHGGPADFVYLRDLTERQKTIDEIRLTKDRLEYVLGATHTGFDIIDPDYNVIYVDPAWANSLGDYHGKKCYDYFMGLKGPCDGCGIPEALKTKKTIVTEEYLKKEEKYLEVHTIPFKTDEGNWLVAEFNIDVTERKRTHKALAESEGKYRILAENISDVIFMINSAFELTYISPSITKLAGYTPEEAMSRKITEVFTPKSLMMAKQKIGEEIKKVAKNPKAKSQSKATEIELLTKDGNIIMVETVTNYIWSKEGTFTGLIGMLRDITERRKAEVSIRESEEKYRKLMEKANDAIFLADAKTGVLMDVNQKAIELTGLTRDEMIGMHQTKLHPPEEEKNYAKIFKAHVKDSSAIQENIFVIHKDGHKIPVSISASIFELGGQLVNQGIFHDLSESVKNQQQLIEIMTFNESIITNSPIGLVSTDMDGKITKINPSALNILGSNSAEETMKFNVLTFEHLVKQGISKLFENCLLKGKETRNHTMSYTSFWGKSIVANINLVPLSTGGKQSGSLLLIEDITARRQTEKALREAGEKVRSIFSSIQDLVFGFDHDGIFISCHSPPDSKLYLPPEAFIGKKYSEVLPPHVTKFLDNGFKRNRKNQSFDFEYSLEIAGQEMWFSAKLSPIFLDGEFNGSVAVVRDVTEKKTTEKALQTSEQVYRSLYESTMALGELNDISGIIAAIAEQARNMLDGACSTIYLWNNERNVLVPYYTNAPDEQEKFMSFEIKPGIGLTGLVAERKEGGYANFNDPKAIKAYVPGTKTKKDHIQSIIAEPMLSENKLIGIINVIAEGRVFNDEDLMKLRILAKQTTLAYLHTRNLDELVKSEARFRKMVENIHDGLTIIEDRTVTYVNERAVEIYGYPAEELKKMTHLDLIIPEDREQMRQIIENAMQTGVMLGELEFWIQRKDGSRRYVRTRISTTMDGGRASEFIITTDITERKLAEDENKRKMMKYLLDDGRLYLVKEFRPSMSLEAFNDLLNMEYFGLLLSRTPKKDMLRSITGPFEHFWLGEQMEGEELFQKILFRITQMTGKSVVLIDRLDYLVFKFGFKETLAFIFKLRDLIYLKEQVVIVSMDTSTMKEEELNIMQKEMSEIELRQIPKPSEELFEIAQIIYEKNSSGLKPSYSEIGDELKLSKPTFRKRVRRLINGGYVVEIIKGNKKVLELTQKGRSLFFK